MASATRWRYTELTVSQHHFRQIFPGPKPKWALTQSTQSTAFEIVGNDLVIQMLHG
jgi:hypothetical protein